MLGRSVTFGPKSVEKRPQQENFFELTTPNEYDIPLLTVGHRDGLYVFRFLIIVFAF